MYGVIKKSKVMSWHKTFEEAETALKSYMPVCDLPSLKIVIEVMESLETIATSPLLCDRCRDKLTDEERM